MDPQVQLKLIEFASTLANKMQQNPSASKDQQLTDWMDYFKKAYDGLVKIVSP